ncbi:signal peptidase I [Treponema sp.]|uniref:signal peptidase I n=1 Tax=Treponema sp. TaxID=166 RepID=UPI003890CA3F
MRKIKVPGYMKSLITGICIGILIKFFIMDMLVVNGTSMEPTLQDGQRIIVNKLAYGIAKPFGSNLILAWNRPDEEEIVVFLYKGRLVVKRCVAVENTPLEYSNESEYTLKIKDREYPLTELQYNLLKETSSVPEDTVLVIGDNYLNSIDSRTYGFVPRMNILGRIKVK